MTAAGGGADSIRDEHVTCPVCGLIGRAAELGRACPACGEPLETWPAHEEEQARCTKAR